MSDIATTLKLRIAIQGQADVLIRAAARNVALLENTGMEKSQIRNVVNLAGATESMEEVTNFIRYQIGRQPNVWGGFGKALIADIERGVIKTALEAVMREAPQSDPRQARAELTARYLGYLNRCFVYAKVTNDWKDLCSNVEQTGGVA
jgi:hypothetical protein